MGRRRFQGAPRRLLVLTAALLLGVGLTGCGSDDGGESGGEGADGPAREATAAGDGQGSQEGSSGDQVAAADPLSSPEPPEPGHGVLRFVDKELTFEIVECSLEASEVAPGTTRDVWVLGKGSDGEEAFTVVVQRALSDRFDFSRMDVVKLALPADRGADFLSDAALADGYRAEDVSGSQIAVDGHRVRTPNVVRWHRVAAGKTVPWQMPAKLDLVCRS